MQAILTKFIAPTNHRPSRVRASAAAGAVTVPWDHHLDTEENHIKAAQALVKKLNWESKYYTPLVCGTLPNGDYAHVFTMKVTPGNPAQAREVEHL